jgi:hypothetical protein
MFPQPHCTPALCNTSNLTHPPIAAPPLSTPTSTASTVSASALTPSHTHTNAHTDTHPQAHAGGICLNPHTHPPTHPPTHPHTHTHTRTRTPSCRWAPTEGSSSRESQLCEFLKTASFWWDQGQGLWRLSTQRRIGRSSARSVLFSFYFILFRFVSFHFFTFYCFWFCEVESSSLHQKPNRIVNNPDDPMFFLPF